MAAKRSPKPRVSVDEKVARVPGRVLLEGSRKKEKRKKKEEDYEKKEEGKEEEGVSIISSEQDTSEYLVLHFEAPSLQLSSPPPQTDFKCDLRR